MNPLDALTALWSLGELPMARTPMQDAVRSLPSVVKAKRSLSRRGAANVK